MVDSILNTIKIMLGIKPDYTAFDVEIITNINSAFMTLYQLGVGPTQVFSIEDQSAIWSQFVSDETRYSLIKSYIYLFVREIFDPPTSGIVMTSLQKQRAEFEWRLSIQPEITDG